MKKRLLSAILLIIFSTLLGGCAENNAAKKLTKLEQACQEFRRGATNMTGGSGRAQGHFLSSGRHFRDIEADDARFKLFSETLRKIGESLAKDSSGAPLKDPELELTFREIRDFCK